MKTAAKPHKYRSHQHKKAKTMKNVLFSSLAAIALAAAPLGLTPTASAAPAGPSTVDATIEELRSEGFEVIVNRIGDGPQEQCTVGAVRPGQEYTRFDSGVPGANGPVLMLIGKTVYVDIMC
jgi:hypothetical protein